MRRHVLGARHQQCGQLLAATPHGNRVGLDELVMFFALLGGLQVFGVLGAVLGPVLFAIAASMVDVLTDTNPTGGL
jgi:predicted PurR-regulated permease PerM